MVTIEYGEAGKVVWFSVNRDEKKVASVVLYVIGNENGNVLFGLIHDLFVDKEYRRTDVGQDLLKAVLEEAKVAKCHKVIAISSYVMNYFSRLYDHCGFVNAGKELAVEL